MKVIAIVPAAGSGSRMNSRIPKQYMDLEGIPVLARTLKTLELVNSVSEILVATESGGEKCCRQAIVERYGLKKVTDVVTGGETRQQSVYNALKAIKGPCDMVLVHDGVRPLVKPETVVKAIEGAARAGAAVVASACVDTIKLSREDAATGARYVDATPDRSTTWAASTPQVFQYDILMEAHAKAIEDGISATDDAMLVERLGHTVLIVEGSRENVKITSQMDLEVAALILRNRERLTK